MKIMPLNLCFKGQRNYLHGTDIYDSVCEAVCHENANASGVHVRFVFHSFATTECELHLSLPGEDCTCPGGAVAEVSFAYSSGIQRGWLVETARPVTCRRSFPEEEIVAASAIGDKSISLCADLAFSPIEVAVALTKHLHNTLFPVTDQRWVLSKLDLSRMLRPGDTGSMVINLQSNLHNRITKSSVVVGVALLGDIYFSAVSK